MNRSIAQHARHYLLALAAGLTALSLLACQASPHGTSHDPAAVHVATAPADAITLDGKLDDPAWANATPIALAQIDDRPMTEGGEARLLITPTRLYVGIRLVDRDIVQEDDQNERMHFTTGDVLELFLKPADAPHYWEFYVTPPGNKTAFFYPSRGYKGLPSTLAYESNLAVAAAINGTLNQWQDDDTGWTAEMALPLDELGRAGVPFGPSRDWTVLIARYNYGRHLNELEFSSAPSLPKLDYHDHDHYGKIVFD